MEWLFDECLSGKASAENIFDLSITGSLLRSCAMSEKEM